MQGHQVTAKNILQHWSLLLSFVSNKPETNRTLIHQLTGLPCIVKITQI